MKTNRLFRIALSVAILLGIASCGKDDTNPTPATPRETHNRVLSLLGPGVDQYWQQVQQGITTGFDASNIKLEWAYQINSTDANTLTSGIYRGISTRDSLLGIIVLPYNDEVESAIKQALKQNIRIVLLEECSNDSLVNACHAIIKTNNISITDSFCNVIKRNETTGDILFVGQYTNTTCKQRFDRVKSSCPTWYGYATQGEDAADAIDSILNEHPSIQTIALLNGSILTSSLYQQIQDKHLYAIDRNSVTEQAFNDTNMLCLVEQNPKLLGEYAATLLRTEKPEQKVNYVPVIFRYPAQKNK